MSSTPLLSALALVFALALASLSATGVAQSTCEDLKQIYNISEKDDRGWIDRVHSVSTESPVTRSVRANPNLAAALEPTFSMFAKVASLVDDRRKSLHPEACNLPNSLDWRKNLEKRTRNYQIGILNEECFTSVDVRRTVDAKELDKSILDNARTYMSNARAALFEAASNVALDLVPGNSNWTAGAPYKIDDKPRRRAQQTCSIEALTAYRVRDNWYLHSVVTNKPITINQPKGFRQNIVEWIPRYGNDALRMVHFNYTPEGKECLVNSSTLLTTWGGFGTLSPEGYNFDSSVHAVTRAYSQNLVAVDLASDAVTVSNIAILALPMAMNIIPVAFVTDLNAFGMFAYVLVTDIFSTIPFLVKGVELIQSSLPRQEEVVAFHGGNSTLGAVELWSAVCQGKESFRTMGIIFVVVAIVIMFSGIALEIWAKTYMRRRQAAAGIGAKVYGPFAAGFNEAALSLTYDAGLDDKPALQGKIGGNGAALGPHGAAQSGVAVIGGSTTRAGDWRDDERVRTRRR